jgi:alanine dehydrogenase
VPLYLTENDVTELIGPADAVEAIEECFRRMARGSVEIAPRRRLRLEEGSLADMAASDLELGLAGGKLYAAGGGQATFVVCLFDAETTELVAVLEADQLGRLRTGAASGVAARYLARGDARTLGVIGCGHQAETQVACVRAAVPSLERVVGYCRTPERLAAFCERVGAEPADSHNEAGAQDIVVTITSSRDPVLRGEWLVPGALVVGAGANVPSRRELDNAVLQRARFVCCDLREQARLESGDLIEPVEAGVLDWLEVHELHEVVAGEIAGRQAADDIVVFKSNGLAAWDVAIAAVAVERARERGVGTEV